jgi:predicted secreted acid phosphatase
MPSIYIPAHVKKTVDMTKFHERMPEDMTRDQIADFEQIMKDPDYFRNKDMTWKRNHPEWKQLKEELLKIQPQRHLVIKRYWDMNKHNPEARTAILEMAEQTEDLPKQVLEEEYVYYRDAIPQIDNFLNAIEEQKLKEIQEEKVQKVGDITFRIGNKLADFNPFDADTDFKKERAKDLK